MPHARARQDAYIVNAEICEIRSIIPGEQEPNMTNYCVYAANKSFWDFLLKRWLKDLWKEKLVVINKISFYISR